MPSSPPQHHSHSFRCFHHGRPPVPPTVLTVRRPTVPAVSSKPVTLQALWLLHAQLSRPGLSTRRLRCSSLQSVQFLYNPPPLNVGGRAFPSLSCSPSHDAWEGRAGWLELTVLRSKARYSNRCVMDADVTPPQIDSFFSRKPINQHTRRDVLRLPRRARGAPGRGFLTGQRDAPPPALSQALTHS